MPLDPQRVKALFQSAMEHDSPADRSAFLDRECQADADLRHRLEELLAAFDRSTSATVIPLADEATVADFTFDATSAIPSGSTMGPGSPDMLKPERPPVDFSSPVGSTIADRYKIRQEIGEGGMGSVYLAEQFQPVKRMVALKLIKAGMDSRMVLARFDSERQALAIMDHPHIAHVLDAGTTENGRPFFVMELVKGLPLTTYCDQHRLGIPERLALFQQICSAVQHAHQKGIIHRDLKPTNILVEEVDDHPVPKVIDFGLAKATSGLQLGEQSLFTAFGTINGTPLYMAPEQATFNPIDVDTRADIYALGVILYELLTGSTPIRRESIVRAAFDEILRVVREDEPPTPSHRISTSEGLPSLAAVRLLEPARLGRFVRGDLDWIVMKALAKDRNRRYESAIGLANDVDRFLKDEPVTAGPPTATYRASKFFRRHRGRVLAASLFLLALVGGVIGTTLGLVEARTQGREAERQKVEAERQRSVAMAETVEKEQARLAESDQRRRAELRLSQIEKMNDILGSIFADLNPDDPANLGKPLAALLGERLDQATLQIAGEAIGDPLAVARMQATLGRSQLGLGYPQKAIDLFAQSLATLQDRLGPNHPDTLTGMNLLATAYRDSGHLDQAMPLFEQVLTLRKAKLGPNDADTLDSMKNLAWGYQTVGKLDLSVPLYEETLRLRQAKFGPDHRSTLDSMDNLALAYHYAGRMDQAIPLYEQAYEARKKTLRPDDPDILTSMHNLASGYMSAGQQEKALALHKETFEAFKAKLGADHPRTLISMSNIASGLISLRRYDQAVPLLEQTLELRKAKLGADHPDTLNSMSKLAEGYNMVGQFNRALPLAGQAVEMRKAKLGADHPDTMSSLNTLAVSHQALGQLDQALPLFEQVLALRKAKLGSDHPDTLSGMLDLAVNYQVAGRSELAVPLLEETLAARKTKIGADHPTTLFTMGVLADCYRGNGQLDQAVSLAREHVDAVRRRDGADSIIQTGSLETIGRALLQKGDWTGAEATLRQCLAIRQSKSPDSWRTFGTISLVGEALLGEKKYPEAKSWLVDGYEGMKRRTPKIPPALLSRITEALDRLIRWAEATGETEEANIWRQEKLKANLPPAPTPKPDAGKP